ncbi:helix-turn-helix domain-containing protein [Kitasatospora arboriphila]
MRTSLESSVRTLLDPPGTWEAARLCSWQIGARRAQRELPLDALLHAFRLGGALVWRRLVETATRREPDHAHLLLHSAAGIWSFVDEHSDLITQAYRLVESQTAREHRERARAMVQALLDGTTRITDLPTVAAALDLPERGRYAVAALAGPVGPPRHPAEAAPVLAEPPPGCGSSGTAAPTASTPSSCSATPTRPRSPPASATTAAPGSASAPSSRSSPRSAPPGAPPTSRCAPAPPTATSPCCTSGCPPPWSSPSPTSAPRWSTGHSAPSWSSTSRTASRCSARSTSGWTARSAQRAGTRLFCHRNTVLNRLRRYEQLSGRSLNHPRHLVELSLALDAYRLLPS